MLCLNGQLNEAVPGIDIVELNVVIESFFSERHRFVDLHRFRELSVRLQVTSLVGRVLEDHVSLAVLVVTKANLKSIFSELTKKYRKYCCFYKTICYKRSRISGVTW